MKHRELEDYTGRLLEIDRFRDYCPNGLQIEGNRDIARIATGVTASLAFLEKARDFEADAVFVHHGYFWKGSDPRITGMARRRIALLLESGMSLFAYHLPLDAHPEFGNNAMLAKRLGISVQGRFGEQNIAMIGELDRSVTLEEFGEAVSTKLSRTPLLVGDGKKTLRTVSWCSGAAQGMLLEAATLGADAFLSGEISEHTVHEALESGVAYISAGHHATERYGIRALGEHLSERFGLRHEFIDCDIPV